jgi:hypothetical protein
LRWNKNRLLLQRLSPIRILVAGPAGLDFAA